MSNIFIASDGFCGLFDYQLKLGAFVLEFIFSAVLFIGGIGCLVGLLFSFRKKHPPLKFKIIFAWVACAFLLSSVVNLAGTFPEFCKTSTGNCNSVN